MSGPLVVVKTGVILLGASWARVREHDYRTDMPSPSYVAVNYPILHNDWEDPTWIPPVYAPGSCYDLPNPQPIPGSWEAYLSGAITIDDFIAMHVGTYVGVQAIEPYPTGYRWCNPQMLCLEACPLTPNACWGGGAWPVEVEPGYVTYYGQHEMWGSELGQDVRLDVVDGASFTVTTAHGNPVQFVTTMTVSAFCSLDADLSGMLNVNDFSAFLNNFAAGYGDWNQDGAADVLDFAEYLNAWAQHPCVP